MDELFGALLEAIKTLQAEDFPFDGPHIQWYPLYIMDIARSISKQFSTDKEICPDVRTTLEKRLDIACPQIN